MNNSNELSIKLDIACENLKRFMNNEVLVERYIARQNEFNEAWARMAKKHTVHEGIMNSYYYHYN